MPQIKKIIRIRRDGGKTFGREIELLNGEETVLSRYNVENSVEQEIGDSTPIHVYRNPAMVPAVAPAPALVAGHMAEGVDVSE